MEQARIEHAPNGSLLTYITIADAMVNNALYSRQMKKKHIKLYLMRTYTYNHILI